MARNFAVNFFLRMFSNTRRTIDRDMKGIRSFSGEVDKLEESAEAFELGVSRAAIGLGMAGMAGATVLATARAAKFEEVISRVAITLGGGEVALEELRSGLLSVSGVTGRSTEDLAEMAETAGQAGFGALLGAKGMIAFADTLAKFTAVSKMQTAEAGRIFTRLADQLKLFQPGDEAGNVLRLKRLASAIQLTGKTSTSGAGEVARFMEALLPLRQTLKMTIPEMLGLAGASRSFGRITTELLATQPQRIFQRAMDPKKAAAFAKVMGIDTVQAMQDLLKTDAHGFILRLLLGLDRAGKASGEYITVTKDLGLANLRLIPILAGATTQVEKIKTMTAQASDEMTGLGQTLEQDFAKITDNFNQQLKIMQENFDNLLKVTGRPYLKPLTFGLRGANAALQGLVAIGDTFIGQLAMITITITPLVAAFRVLKTLGLASIVAKPGGESDLLFKRFSQFFSKGEMAAGVATAGTKAATGVKGIFAKMTAAVPTSAKDFFKKFETDFVDPFTKYNFTGTGFFGDESIEQRLLRKKMVRSDTIAQTMTRGISVVSKHAKRARDGVEKLASRTRGLWNDLLGKKLTQAVSSASSVGRNAVETVFSGTGEKMAAEAAKLSVKARGVQAALRRTFFSTSISEMAIGGIFTEADFLAKGAKTAAGTAATSFVPMLNTAVFGLLAGLKKALPFLKSCLWAAGAIVAEAYVIGMILDYTVVPAIIYAWENMKFLYRTVKEAVQTGSIAAEDFMTLEKINLDGVFIGLVTVVKHAQVFIDGFFAAFDGFGNTLSEFARPFKAVVDIFAGLLNMLGILPAFLGKSMGSLGNLGRLLGWIIRLPFEGALLFMKPFTDLLEWIAYLVDKIGPFISNLAGFGLATVFPQLFNQPFSAAIPLGPWASRAEAAPGMTFPVQAATTPGFLGASTADVIRELRKIPASGQPGPGDIAGEAVIINSETRLLMDGAPVYQQVERQKALLRKRQGSASF